MPVLRDDRVVGVVSRRDLVALLARPDEEIERRVREVLSREGLRFAPAGVRVHDGIVELSGAERDTLQRAQSLARAEPGVFDVRLREA
jgi:CBS domain-containing protein